MRQILPANSESGPSCTIRAETSGKISLSFDNARFRFKLFQSLWNLSVACQISKQCGNFSTQYRGFETSRDLALRSSNGISASWAETRGLLHWPKASSLISAWHLTKLGGTGVQPLRMVPFFTHSRRQTVTLNSTNKQMIKSLSPLLPWHTFFVVLWIKLSKYQHENKYLAWSVDSGGEISPYLLMCLYHNDRIQRSICLAQTTHCDVSIAETNVCGNKTFVSIHERERWKLHET